MDTDLSPLIANQAKLVEKAQNLALVDLTEKNSEMVDTHMNLLFTLYEFTEWGYDEDDDGDDKPVDKPSPQPEDSRKY
ncbi:MAG: hypothetical protein IM526_02590 [Microcystis sp. M38BS1]|uniref:hypothetical protein n=1 Tax=Microcystis sp. M38BS1 TaxID=2771188 RepID=UPI0031FE16EF|nr:hypothetical protein [Microcystis sp. M38BS1]MCA6582548.1 hypothetical protein [Pseudanabaena sp. M34BS1SP1A06MG]